VSTAILEAFREYAEVQKAALDALVATLEAAVESGDTEAVEEVVETVKPAKKAAAAKKAAKKAAPAPVEEPEEDEDETEDEDDATEAEAEEEDEETAARRVELAAMKITGLRALAKKRGFKPDQVAEASKEDLVDAILEDERLEREGQDAGDDDAEETEELTREELEEKSLRELKALAMEKGHTKALLTGLKSEDVIDLLLGEGDAEEEAEEDEDEESEEEGEDGYYTREQLQAMSLPELKAIAREYEQSGDYPDFKVPAGIKKPALIDLLLS
jgi:hypothetical protein